jgi:hypothetical protein
VVDNDGRAEDHPGRDIGAADADSALLGVRPGRRIGVRERMPASTQAGPARVAQPPARCCGGPPQVRAGEPLIRRTSGYGGEPDHRCVAAVGAGWARRAAFQNWRAGRRIDRPGPLDTSPCADQSRSHAAAT